MTMAISVRPGEITILLDRFRAGSREAERDLLDVVYPELRRLAMYYLSRERKGHTLQPTALVHEAYIRLVGQRDKEWLNRSHFLGVLGQIMRRVLVDHARSANARKRKGNRTPLDEKVLVFSAEDPSSILEIDSALNRLAEWDARQARIVELRYFAGLSIEETADLLEISSRTVRREWTLARAWLHGELEGHG